MKDQSTNPEMPKPEPAISLGSGISLKLLHDFNRFSTGSMVMRMADTNIEIRQGREVVGSMGSAMGGQMYIAHGQCLWAIDKQMLWDAFLVAEKEQYLEPDDPEVCDCQNFPTHISNACPIHG